MESLWPGTVKALPKVLALAGLRLPIPGVRAHCVTEVRFCQQRRVSAGLWLSLL